MKNEFRSVSPIGMGCWAIGGPFYNGKDSLGWGAVDDAQSIRALHAAYDHGVRIFDTAAVYGAGHSERIVGEALKSRNECLIVTKIGLKFDEVSKQVLGADTNPANVTDSIVQSLERLQRDSIDLLLLHLNDLPVNEAEQLFDVMENACNSGMIRSYGWSTDFPDSVNSVYERDRFVSVEHCMNVFVNNQSIQNTVMECDLIPLIRSPLAMGVLTGKYNEKTRFPDDDNRSRQEAWRDYFVDSAVDRIYLNNLNSIRDCLMSDGRSLTQGALAWIMGKSPNNIPIPGARTADQIVESAAAVEFGPLSNNVMLEIESLIERCPEGEPRER